MTSDHTCYQRSLQVIPSIPLRKQTYFFLSYFHHFTTSNRYRSEAKIASLQIALMRKEVVSNLLTICLPIWEGIDTRRERETSIGC